LVPGVRLKDVSQGLLCAVERIPILVIEPIVLKQALGNLRALATLRGADYLTSTTSWLAGWSSSIAAA
jgi:hypothetical protein